MTPEQSLRAAKVFDLLLKTYEDILENGEEYIDDRGQAQRRRPSAAMCGRIQAWLIKHDIGRAPAAGEAQQSAIAARLQKLRESTPLRFTGQGRLPPVSEAPDAATGT